jgi:hypothetical protein
MDLNFPMFATGVHIFRSSNDVGPLFLGPHEATFFSPAAFFAAGFFAFFGVAAFGLAAFFAFAGSLAAFTSPILKDPDAPVPFACFKFLIISKEKWQIQQ